MTSKDPQHLDKLAGVHPRLCDYVNRIILAMNALGFRMMVTDGLRTVTQQQALYAQGRSMPGKIVTNDDGVVHRSNHQAHADGLGYAVDMTFVDADGAPSWDTTKFPFALYGAMAKSLGLKWGGDWTTIKDMPHIELPDGVSL